MADTRTPAQIEIDLMNLQENISDLVALMTPEEFCELAVVAKDVILRASKRVEAEMENKKVD